MQLGGQRGPTSGCHSSAGVSRCAGASPGRVAGQSSPQFSSSAAPESESPQGEPGPDVLTQGHGCVCVCMVLCTHGIRTCPAVGKGAEGRELWT